MKIVEFLLSNLATIIIACLIAPLVTSVFEICQQARNKAEKRMSGNNFIVQVPQVVCLVGILDCLAALILMIAITLSPTRHWVGYVGTAPFYIVGMYLILKPLKFKVVVKGEKITVYSIIRRPFSFTFSEISSAVRRVKKNKVGSESIVIKTASGKIVNVESAEVAYEKFKKRIETEVDKSRLRGFE